MMASVIEQWVSGGFGSGSRARRIETIKDTIRRMGFLYSYEGGGLGSGYILENVGNGLVHGIGRAVAGYGQAPGDGSGSVLGDGDGRGVADGTGAGYNILNFTGEEA